MTRLAFLVCAALATVRCGTVLGSLASPRSTSEHAASRPQERDAALACSGKPCDAATLSRYTTGRLSIVGFAIGSAIDVSIVAGGGYAVSKNGNAGSGALLTAGIVFTALDVL